MQLSSERGVIPQYALVAGVIIAFLSLVGIVVAPPEEPLAQIRLVPQTGIVLKDTTFSVRIMIDASTPVNVFKGEVDFDPTQLQVDSIDYNTSIAELWAEKPWYANGEGTINFIGGTTKPGGFNGTGMLMTINFRPLGLGDTTLRLIEPQILAHDGLGSDVPLSEPLDALFTIESDTRESGVSLNSPEPASIAVVETLPDTDLNDDGEQTIADVSIFITGLVSQKPAYDFNGDGSVDTKDLSIIMSAQ